MQTNVTYNPNWWQGLTLAELLGTFTDVVLSEDLSIDPALGQRRYKNWQDQSSAETPLCYAAQLGLNSATNDTEALAQRLQEILGITPATAAAYTDTPLDWVLELESIYSATCASQAPSLQEQTAALGVNFAPALWPVVKHLQTQLEQTVESLTRAAGYTFDTHHLATILSQTFSLSLIGLMGRTLVLEMNVARLRQQLEGDAPEARYQSYLRLLAEPAYMLRLFNEYPVLARQVINLTRRWLFALTEFYQDLLEDWALISTTFSVDSPPLITHIDLVGDQHHGGRQVIIVECVSGFKIVYKPRPLSVHVHFQELLSWLNEHGCSFPYKSLEVLDCGDHGWVEFVTHLSCETQTDLEQFFKRQGGYLALLYLLRATDFHFENLLAVGANPILLDLETLFSPSINREPVDNLLDNTFDHSVLNVGLLPRLLPYEAGSLDIGGLSHISHKKTPWQVAYWDRANTDEMRLSRKQIDMPEKGNFPTLQNKAVALADFREAFIAGFVEVYGILAQHKAELSLLGGPLHTFANDIVRVILRSTQIYTSLLNSTGHPDLLHYGVDQDFHLSRLWTSPFGSPVAFAEQTDLLAGDVPIFTTTTTSHHLYTSTGVGITGFFKKTGMTLVLERLEGLSESDLARQLWLIEASLKLAHFAAPSPSNQLLPHDFSAVSVVHFTPLSDVSFSSKLLTPAASAEALQIALAIGNRLNLLALKKPNDGAVWLGLEFATQSAFYPAVQTDLYDGLSGIILFLAYLGKYAPKEDSTVLAQAALVALQRYVKQMMKYPSVGGFTGLGSIIYLLSHLGVLWGDSQLLDQAVQLARVTTPQIKNDNNFDIVAGSGGYLLVLLSLYTVTQLPELLDMAIQCGDWLASHALRQPSGIGWPVAAKIAPQPLTGFAHGAAGIAFALTQLAIATGKEHYSQLALDAVQYEQSTFLPAIHNWPDFRELKSFHDYPQIAQPQAMIAWCHGAAGIGLGRIQMGRFLSAPGIQKDIEIALELVGKLGFTTNHSLCHGALGNLELLVQAALLEEQTEWKVILEQAVVAVLQDIRNKGWRTGVPAEIEVPGLMTGIAGIGYQLLRLVAPDHVPSVLLLEPPMI